MIRRFSLIVCSALLIAAPAGAQTVFTGLDVSFSKAGFSDFTDPANQDAITPGVVITRGNTRGLFNTVLEGSYTLPANASPSPLDTEWAFLNNNPAAVAADINAANFANLTFDPWTAALQNNPPTSVGQPGVIHLISEDIYLDVMFTAWGEGAGAGGSFSYMRSIVPEPASAVLLSLGALAVMRRRR